MKGLILFIFLSITVASFGQRANPDALADRNARLEILLLEYKEQLLKSENNIKRLYSENQTLKRQINSLMGKKNKSRGDIEQLMRERSQLLSNKIQLEETMKQRDITIKLLEQTNKQLQKDNAVLKTNNAILEEAASVADTIQRYQDLTIRKQSERHQRVDE